MADIEERVDKLEEKVAQLEKEITTSLGEIKQSLVEIKGYVQGGDNLVNEKIKNHDEKIKHLEDNQSKFIWAIVLEFLALIGGAIKFYLMSGGGH